MSEWAEGALQVQEMDINHDGRVDWLQVDIGAADTTAVLGVNMLLEFSYHIAVR